MGIYPNDLPKLSLEKQAERIVETFRHSGPVEAKRGRVIQICEQVLESAGRETNPGQPGYDELVQAFKDVQEWWFILEVMSESLFRPPFLERFRRSLSDAVLPDRGVAQSQGRDTQFELFIAAIAIRAGFQVKDLGQNNADWLFELPSGCCSVEAKRIKSWSKLENRIRDASKQIKKSLVSGMIVLDIGMAVNVKGIKLDRAVPDDVIDKARRDRDLKFRKDYLQTSSGAVHSRIENWISGRPVGVLMTHDYLIRPAASTPSGLVPWTMMGFWANHMLVPKTSHQYSRYDGFCEQFGQGLPNL